MSKVSENRTVTTKTAGKAIQACFNAKRPVFLWGPPGIGKSELVASITRDMGGHMIDLRLGQMDPTDIRGIPFYNKDTGKMDWAPPMDLPDEELASQYPIIVLFMDELNGAPPAVQSAAYQLVLDRRVGKYCLPDNVVMVAAGNRESDKGVTYRMPTPLANRFVHLEVRPDFAAWQEWAVMNDVSEDVIGYLSVAKQDLHDFDPKSSSRSFATPRSWVFVDELIKQDLDDATLTDLIAGTIGEGLAVKFMAHRKIAGKLPKAEDVLSGKVTDLEIKEPSAMYSLVVSMCYELRDAVREKKVSDEQFHKMADHFFGYMMKNFETEITVMGARIALTQYDLPLKPAKIKNFDEFYKRFGKYILNA
jgi:MoxR-like ATPase